MAQNLSLGEAKSIAHQLYEIELLSEKGEKVLIEGLDDFSIETKSDSIEKSFILKFLYYAFDTDSYYRSGTPTQKQHEILSLEQGFENIEILKVEEIIKNEEEQIKENDSLGGWVIYPPIYVDEENTNIIHKNRSTFGKTTTRTLNDLFKIGLINKSIFEELSQKIKKENIRGEAEIIRLILIKI